eukprot:COSAG02_NODE_17728_length_985_cov_0.786682_1_plen_115_part_00
MYTTDQVPGYLLRKINMATNFEFILTQNSIQQLIRIDWRIMQPIKHLDLNWTKPEGSNSGGYIRKVDCCSTLILEKLRRKELDSDIFLLGGAWSVLTMAGLPQVAKRQLDLNIA